MEMEIKIKEYPGVFDGKIFHPFEIPPLKTHHSLILKVFEALVEIKKSN